MNEVICECGNNKFRIVWVSEGWRAVCTECRRPSSIPDQPFTIRK